MTLAHPILAGVNGWHRWSSWSAHFFADGVQACNTAHGNYMGGQFEPQRPKPAEIGPSGVPYGRVCQRCLKIATERQCETKDGGTDR